MKWFQHEVHFHNDEKIRELIHEKGLEGYGFLNVIYELISEKIDSKMEAKISIKPAVVAEKCRMRSVKVQLLSSYCATLRLFSFNFDGTYLNYECPNLLKRLDNWTKRSVVTTEQVSTNKNKKEKENKNINSAFANSSSKKWFEEIWNKYPNRVGKKQAQRHYEATVKTEKDRESCLDALSNYEKHLAVNTWKKPQNGSTWFNNWQDWVNWKEPETVEGKAEKLERSLRA